MSIQLKRSLSSNINNSYILKDGQIGIEKPSDKNTSSSPFKFKIGDGTSNWDNLPYAAVAPNQLSSYVSTSRTINEKALTTDITLNAEDVKARPIDTSSAIGIDSLALGSNAAARDRGSTAIGTYAQANGYFSVALGAQSYATGSYAIASGLAASAAGTDSIAIASSATASSNYAVAIGGSVNASAIGATSIGHAAKSDNNGGVAIGQYANSYSGWYAIAVGYRTIANGFSSVAIGANASSSSSSIAIGPYSSVSDTMLDSIAIGKNTAVTSDYSVAIGEQAKTSTNSSIQLGNASRLSNLSCRVSLSVTSDERDKTDIEEITDGATEFLKKIKAVTYVYNFREQYRPAEPEKDNEGNDIIEEGVDYLTEHDRSNLSKYGFCRYDEEAHSRGTQKGTRRRSGVIAQDVQKALNEVYGSPSYANIVNDNLFDELTVPDDIENQLSVSYENFIPFLIKSIQELDARITKLEDM